MPTYEVMDSIVAYYFLPRDIRDGNDVSKEIIQTWVESYCELEDIDYVILSLNKIGLRVNLCLWEDIIIQNPNTEYVTSTYWVQE